MKPLPPKPFDKHDSSARSILVAILIAIGIGAPAGVWLYAQAPEVKPPTVAIPKLADPFSAPKPLPDVRPPTATAPSVDWPIARSQPSIINPSEGLDIDQPALAEAWSALASMKQNYSQLVSEDRAAEAAPLKAKIREQLQRIFDLRQKAKSDELAAIELRVAKLRQRLKRREENARQIVDSQLEQIVRDADGLGWGDEPNTYGDPSTSNELVRPVYSTGGMKPATPLEIQTAPRIQVYRSGTSEPLSPSDAVSRY